MLGLLFPRLTNDAARGAELFDAVVAKSSTQTTPEKLRALADYIEGRSS